MGHPTVVRHNRRTRLYHAAVAAIVLTLLATGWWLLTGHEGRPSVLAQLVGVPDTEIHRWAGWILAGLAVVPLTIGIRASVTFVRETFRIDRGDGRWFLRWPYGAVTGRFVPHRGHFDPGQRVANIGIVVIVATLVVTGVGLTVLHGGPTFAWLARLHRLATFALIPLVAGHVFLAIGMLPGYRGARRTMGVTGHVSVDTVRRLWPRDVPDPDVRDEDHPGDDPRTSDREPQANQERGSRPRRGRLMRSPPQKQSVTTNLGRTPMNDQRLAGQGRSGRSVPGEAAPASTPAGRE